MKRPTDGLSASTPILGPGGNLLTLKPGETFEAGMMGSTCP